MLANVNATAQVALLRTGPPDGLPVQSVTVLCVAFTGNRSIACFVATLGGGGVSL